METPPPEPIVRRTRSALAEIPTRMGVVTPSENRLNANVNNNTENVLTNLHVDINQLNIIPTTYMTPSPSPDELVIQARGRRRIPPWSPNASYRPTTRRGGESPRKDRTPVKSDNMLSSPNKSTIVLRSTPRKRLLMCDPMEAGSPERKPQSPKRMKLETITVPPAQGLLEFSLKALSHEQLIKVILGAAEDPNVEEEIKANLPAPDLKPIAEKLNSLRKNIFKCLPNSRLMSKTDSPAYNRASTHVLIFKKAVLEAGRNIISSQQWEAVISYIILGWEQTSATPLWESPPHNVPRKQCFKYLASQCMLALRKLNPINLSPPEADRLLLKLKGFVKDSEEITQCVQYLESVIEKMD